MKRLTITYNEDTILFDGLVDEFAWQDSAQQVSVVGKFKRQPAAGGGGLLEMLTSARKDKTAAIVQERKAELDLEAQE